MEADTPMTQLFDEAQAARADRGEVEHEFRSYTPMQTTPRKDNPNSLSVVACRSCGESHDSVEFGELTTPTPPYTHHFTCPATNDPVYLAMIQGPTGGSVSVNADVLRDLVLAQARGKYMVCVFSFVDGDPRPVKLERKSVNFPAEALDACAGILQSIADHQLGRRQATPLPRARPSLGLFPGLTGSDPARDVAKVGQNGVS